MAWWRRSRKSVTSVTVEISDDLDDVDLHELMVTLLARYQAQPENRPALGLALLGFLEKDPGHPQSLAIARTLLGDFRSHAGAGDGSTLYASRVLGKALVARGMLGEAEENYRAALHTSVRHTGERSTSSTAIRNDLFVVLASHDRLKEAVTLHRTVKVSGVDAVLEQRRLADLLAVADRPEEAVAEYRAALRDAESLLGRDHVETINIRTLLAMLAIEIRHPVAEEAQRGVIIDLERATEPDDESLLVARSNLAELLATLGRTDEAVASFRQVIDDHQRVFGERHHGTIITTANFADMLRTLGRGREAVELFETVLPLASDVLGPDHPVTQNARAAVDDAGSP